MGFRIFGFGVGKAIAGERTEGVVTDVKTCWWLKINTKPVRRNMFDGAAFPHIIHFTYSVDGQAYQGKCYVNWNKHCPQKGEKLVVYYEKEKPKRYAVIVNGPRQNRL